MGACGYTSSCGVQEEYSRSGPETPTSVLYIAARSLVAAQRQSSVNARMTDSLIRTTLISGASTIILQQTDVTRANNIVILTIVDGLMFFTLL